MTTPSIHASVATDPLVEAQSSFATAAQTRQSDRNVSPRITLRLTEEENAHLRQLSAGTSISSYVRKCIFGQDVAPRKVRERVPVKEEQALAKILGSLGESRIANNLNQITYQANCGLLQMDEATEEEIKMACARIAWIRVKLIEALGLKDDG